MTYFCIVALKCTCTMILVYAMGTLHVHLQVMVVFFLQSYREFKKTDIEMWMKAVNIDIYWSYFERGGITDGESLESVNLDTLSVSEVTL